MKALAIFPSVRDTPNFGKYAANFARYKREVDIMVIDEDSQYRTATAEQFVEYGFTPEFYGAKERCEWCRKHLGVDADLIIPRRSHDELSFGLLVAYLRSYDLVCFIDDDTYPNMHQDFIGEHYRRLSGAVQMQSRVNYAGGWVNTHPYNYARGYPYSQRPGDFDYSGFTRKVNPVLHMGLWEGIPDLNAIDYLSFDFNSLKANPNFFGKIEDFTLEPGQYAPICSMNLSFKPEIIPAFYQLWDNNRYNDIFSGVFLKRIADHLGRNVSVGNPTCYHEKAPRDIFRDAETELPSIKLNETLWKTLNQTQFTQKTWLSCYRELASFLNEAYVDTEFSDTVYRMSCKMQLWCNVIEKLEAQ